MRIQDFIRSRYGDEGYRSSIRRSLEMKIAFVHVVVVQRCDIVIARDEIENTVSRVKDFKNLKRVLIFYNSILFKSQTCTVHQNVQFPSTRRYTDNW